LAERPLNKINYLMKTLFITYNGALEPLIKSQGIPYLKGLSSRGVDCVLLSFERPPKDRKAFKNKTESLKKELRESGIEWFRLRYHKNPSVPATLFDILIGIIVCIWIVISRKVDIIHARAAVAAVMGYAAARIAGIKFLFDERGLMAEEYADGGMWKRDGVLYRFTRYVEKKLLSSADAIVVLTENIKDFLLNGGYIQKEREWKRPDVTVIPCCVDTLRFNDTPPPDRRFKGGRDLSGKFVFLYTGSLGTWYLLEEMIDFFLAAKSLINNAHFMVLTHIGRSMVMDSWTRRGLSFEDITLEEAEFERMPDYIKLADAGIFFIKPALSKRSSCPIKFAEYLACGLPVVINSSIGDTDIIVEKYRLGAVIRKFDNEGYLNGVNRLLDLKKEGGPLYGRCGAAAKELFSLETGVSRYLGIYNKLKGNQTK
jgi:glycosyltransferase involved in cell wall biosynthesis